MPKEDDATALATTRVSGPLQAVSASVSRGTHQMTSSSAAPLRGLRQLVSGSKQRFQREGFDLDLTYVLPRVIALGLPASSAIEQMYRNPITEVRDFLNRYHTGSYALVNLCDERDYADDEFPDATLMRYPFPDHQPPCLSALVTFCVKAHQYLKKEDNVIAVHCKAGKGRTGVMVAAYLLYIKQPGCPDASAAIHFFRSRRTTDGNAIVNPSQIRYVHYYDKYINASRLERDWKLRGTPIHLIAVSLSAAPSALVAHDASQAISALTNTFARAWTLRVEVYQCVTEDDPREGVKTKQLRLSSSEIRCPRGQKDVRFAFPEEVSVRGDFRISVQSVGVRSEELGWIHLHSTWLPLDSGVGRDDTPTASRRGAKVFSAEFPKDEVDEAHKDPRFAADWRLTLHYYITK